MAELIGTREDFALFSDGTIGVFVRLSQLDVFDPQPLIALNTDEWAQHADPATVPTVAWELAEEALTSADHVHGTDVLVAAGEKDKRTFAVPKSVQMEAKKALAWRKEFNRGGTDVGLNTARTLAKGGSVGIMKVRHIAKYFPRHEADKKGQGWSPGEDGFPSNGRIAWALWGGDPAWRWARRIVERDDARNKTAATLAVSEDTVEVVETEETVDPTAPHVYEPDATNAYACDVCGGYEYGLIHVEPVDEAPTDEELEVLVTTAIEQLERDGIETLAQIEEDPAIVHALYLTDPAKDSWWSWDPSSLRWTSLSDQPSDTVPVDSETVEQAIRTSNRARPDWSLSNLRPDEFELVYGALDSLGEYITSEVRYYTSSSTDTEPDVYAYNTLTNDLWVWDRGTGSWTETAQKIDGLTEVSEDSARRTVLTQRATTTSVNDVHMEFDRVEYFGSYSAMDRAQDAVAYVKDLKALVASNSTLKTEQPAGAGPQPTYAAVVDDYDNDVVLALIAIMPKVGDSPPQVLTRKDGAWTVDQKMFLELQSATPPTLVILDPDALSRVQRQVDFYFREKGKGKSDTKTKDETTASMLVAAGIPGIADTPSDFRAVRRLKRYWSRGPGAAKIRWGTPGDWRRCVKYLSKYMGVRANGYCQNLHKSVTGVYTGDRRNPGRKSRRRRGLSVSGDVLLQVPRTVLSDVESASHTQETVLTSLGVPSLRDVQNLRSRPAGHKLAAGERFLVNGGDGMYVLSVLPVGSTIGWQGQSAIIVDNEKTGTTLLREIDEG